MTSADSGDQRATVDQDGRICVECTECGLRRVVGPGDDKLPAEVVVEHGKETGHKASVTRVGGPDRESG